MDVPILNTKFDLTVQTSIDAGLIHQSLSSHGKIVSAWVMNTRDKEIEKALVKLGWAPPIKPEKRDCGNPVCPMCYPEMTEEERLAKLGMPPS